MPRRTGSMGKRYGHTSLVAAGQQRQRGPRFARGRRHCPSGLLQTLGCCAHVRMGPGALQLVCWDCCDSRRHFRNGEEASWLVAATRRCCVFLACRAGTGGCGSTCCRSHRPTCVCRHALCHRADCHLLCFLPVLHGLRCDARQPSQVGADCFQQRAVLFGLCANALCDDDCGPSQSYAAKGPGSTALGANRDGHCYFGSHHTGCLQLLHPRGLRRTLHG
mmetsp:Transcript_42153/g.106093  ORF Transcript_42153/g.106093 Transcript_42153/m.106093 type:complete len:220 (+) Transcript_42153:1108-1767(+)